MGIVEDLRPYSRIAVDTNICIYSLQPGTKWFVHASNIMMLSARTRELYIPDIVRLELLIRPYGADHSDEMESVRGLLNRGARIEIDDDVIEVAAQLRAMTRMRTPDALVAACASVARCDAIIGNDAAFKDLNAMNNVILLAVERAVTIPHYIHLDDYVDGA